MRSSSRTSWAVSTSFAPSRISRWQPLENGEWIEPGIAKTSRPWSPARRAVMSEPAREVLPQRRRARDELRHHESRQRDHVGELEVARRVDPVEARADARDRRSLALERALVGGGVDADREPRHDREPGGRQRACEGAGILDALGRRVAAADDRERGPVEEVAPPHAEERGRGIGGVEEGLREVRVVPGDEVVRGIGEPPARAFEQPALDRSEDARGGVGRRRGGDLRAGGREHALGAAERTKQRRERGRGDAREREPRPSVGAGVERHGAGVARPLPGGARARGAAPPEAFRAGG